LAHFRWQLMIEFNRLKYFYSFHCNSAIVIHVWWTFFVCVKLYKKEKNEFYILFQRTFQGWTSFPDLVTKKSFWEKKKRKSFQSNRRENDQLGVCHHLRWFLTQNKQWFFSSNYHRYLNYTLRKFYHLLVSSNK